MTDPAGSAISRTPREIWWMILDEAIDCPKHFATTYDGDEWAHDEYAYAHAHGEHDYEYEETEKDRRNIALVCRSWRYFAAQRKGRSICLGTDKTKWPSDTAIKKAHRVYIDCLDETILSSLRQIVDWRILAVRSQNLKDFGQLTLPHLRRLILTHTVHTVFRPNLFIGLFDSLIDLTWLEFCVESLHEFFPSDKRKNNQPIFLPNLQVFIYSAKGVFSFPFGMFEFPALQHLSVKYGGSIGESSPVTKFLLPYKKSLRSVVIRFDHLRQKASIFCQWEELPELREMVLDGLFRIYFHPLPQDHPLERLYTRHFDEDSISSWIESKNLRRIVLLRSKVDQGALKSQRGIEYISSSVMEQLLEKAETRGICLEAVLSM
jgi:hypothetical protein